MKERTIALLTDFGLKDPFVGMMKGVILSRIKDRPVRFIDLTHEVPPRDVSCGAFFLWASLPYLPEGTLVVAVVDPGVGSSRRILWAKTRRLEFLVPDNGILSWGERRETILEARSVENKKLFLPSVSGTFHGRDAFAPVAAALISGLKPAALGPRKDDFVRLPYPEARISGDAAIGEMLAADRFGNCWTNLETKGLPAGGKVFLKGRSLGALKTHYAQVRPGESLALEGSFGVVELAVRNGDFAKCYRMKPGMRVTYRFSGKARGHQ